MCNIVYKNMYHYYIGNCHGYKHINVIVSTHIILTNTQNFKTKTCFNKFVQNSFKKLQEKNDKI